MSRAEAAKVTAALQPVVILVPKLTLLLPPSRLVVHNLKKGLSIMQSLQLTLWLKPATSPSAAQYHTGGR
jgi:hypothetical protein